MRYLILAALAALFLAPDADARGRLRGRCRGGSCSVSVAVGCAAGGPLQDVAALAAVQEGTQGAADDALAEVNAARARRGLRPFLRDDGLTRGAEAVARFRAERGIQGHSANDFSFLPAGARSNCAGCAAWRSGFGACAMFDDYTYCGAAVVAGRDGLRYCHCFYR